MTTREQQYSAQLELSSPQGPLEPPRVQFPESPGTGDRATIRNVLSWCASLVTKAGKRIGALDRLVWSAMFGYADLSSGSAYPALTTLATLTGVSLRRVRTAVRALESVGLLRPHPRPGRPTLYTLLLPESSPLQPAQTPARVARASSSRTRSRPAPQRPSTTPARTAGTPAPQGKGPRHVQPPNVPKEENKSELLARAHAQTPAQTAAVAPAQTPDARETPAATCPTVAPDARAEHAPETDGRTPPQTRDSRPKGARSAQAQALTLALAAHFGSHDPGTRGRLAPPRMIAPTPVHPGTDEHQHPGTTAPRAEPDTPPEIPPALAGLFERVAQMNRAKG